MGLKTDPNVGHQLMGTAALTDGCSVGEWLRIFGKVSELSAYRAIRGMLFYGRCIFCRYFLAEWLLTGQNL